MRINVYIDGFNLYYGSLKGQPYKWLNLERMSELLLPSFEVKRIRYFTARVKERPDDTLAPVRQNAYLRALETLPKVDIHLIRIVCHELGKLVGLLNPQPKPSQRLLQSKPSFAKPIRAGVLRASQFPAVITDHTGGRIIKPQGW